MRILKDLLLVKNNVIIYILQITSIFTSSKATQQIIDLIFKHKMEKDETQAKELNTTPALKLIWGQFRMWDATASQGMSIIRKWRQRVLYLTILGAFFGVLSGVIKMDTKLNINEYAAKRTSQVLAILSTICISLGTYAGGQVLSEEKEKSAIKSRAYAESLKSEAYKYIFKAGKYKKDPDANAFTAVEDLSKDFSGLEALSINKTDEIKFIPEINFSITTYIETRVEDQIYGYYNKKISQFQQQIKKYNKIIFILGFFSVIFGSFGAVGNAEFSVWIAFFASATAALGSFVATSRFQQTIITYQASSNRLKAILCRWESNSVKDEDAIAEFVEDIEEELMRENKAWVAESSKKLKPEDDLMQVAQGIEKNLYKETETKSGSVSQADEHATTHKNKEKKQAKHEVKEKQETKPEDEPEKEDKDDDQKDEIKG